MPDVLLSDGATVHIRPISLDDAERIVGLHARLSDRTRYLRYFSPYPRIPPRDLQRFVNVDHRDREALVVSVAGGDLIAVGRYERLGPASPEAEVAFVVEDSFQGKGIGPLLLEHLAEAARSAGITRFVAEVLPANRPMIKVLMDAGYHVSRAFDEGVVHLAFPIEPTPLSRQRSRSREQHPEAASIARLLTPQSVAVYGVRRDGTGQGATLVRIIVDGGYTGSVSVVHPSLAGPSTMEGVPASPSASQVDLAVVAVPWDRVPAAVADAGAAGAHAAVVLSGGFAEIRASGIAAQHDLVAVARSHGMRLVGPNCLGIVNTDPAVRLNATLVPRMVPHGRIGVFCQSGFVGIAMLSEIDERGLGVSTFVSAGNRADVSGNDLLQYWREDPRTDVVLLYLETFGNAHKFARIARELARDKPIVAVATGAGRPSWHAGQPPDVSAVSALVAHSGLIRVGTVAEMLDVGQILASMPLPAGARVGVVGNAAALVQLASSACEAAGLAVPHSRWLLPGGPPRALRALVARALQLDEVDIVLAVLAPPEAESGPRRTTPAARAVPAIDEALRAITDALEDHASADKTVLAVAIASPSALDGRVPRFRSVEEAVRALARVVRYAQWRRIPPGSVPDLPGVDVEAARGVVAAQGPAEELLATYGVVLAEGGGIPCVVRVVDDPSFGPVVGFSVGGIATELLGDTAWRVAPLTDVDAAALVRSPRAAALLQGYAGAEPVELAALEDLVLRVGRLADEHPAVKRLTLDPVLAHGGGVSVAGARVEYGEPNPRPDTGPRRLR